MEEQILKDFIATAQANGYNWDVVIAKFPELSGYDPQLLKDYVATAEANNYNYAVVNARFPEFFGEVKKKEEPVSSSQEEQLASPMETPTLASLPGRDLTLPPSPRLAPQTQQAIQEAGGVAPQEQLIPVPYETRPTEVVTEDGITMDLETGAIAGETGVSPEAQAAMEARIEEGAVEMPQPEEIKAPDVPMLAAPFVWFNQNVKDALAPEEVKEGFSEIVGAKEWGFSDALKYLSNKGISGMESILSFVRDEGGERNGYILDFIENNKESEPELYAAYQKYAEELKADHPKNYMLLAAEKAYRNVAGVNVLPFVKTAKDQALNTRIESAIRRGYVDDRLNTYGFDVDAAVDRAIEDNVWMLGLGGLVESMPAMLTNSMTHGLSFFNMTVQGAQDELAQQLAQNPDMQLSAAQTNAYLLGRGYIEAELEKMGLGNVLKRTPLLKRALTNRVLTRAIGMGDEVGAEAFEKLIKQEVKGFERYIKSVGAGALSEAETGALQQVAAEGFNAFIRDSEGKRVFSEKTSMEIVDDIIYAGFLEAIGGGVMGGTIGAIARPDRMTSKEFAEAKTFVNNVKMPKVKQYLDDQVKAGKITQEQADGLIASVEEFKNTVDKTPDNISSESQQEIFKLIEKKRQVLDEVRGKDEAIQNLAKKEVAEIDKQIQDIYAGSPKQKVKEDAVQEQATSEVPVQPEAGVGEEVAEGTPQAEPQVAPEARVEEEVTLTEEEQQQLADLRAETLGQAPAAAATREEVTATFEGGRKLSDNLVVNETGAQPLTKEQTRIEKLAVRGAKAIQKLLPDVKIILHATGEEFSKNTGTAATDEGAYNDGVIHINLATADASTVAHEVFHAIFLNKVRTDSKAQTVAKTMMENVRKTLTDDSALAKEIDGFAQNYDENFQNEERLAQLMGALSREYVNATSTVKGQIVEFIKRLARAFNVSLPSDFGKTDESVTAMLDVLARKVVRGKAIMEADLVLIERSTAGKKPTAKRRKINVDAVRSSGRPGSKVGRGLSVKKVNKQIVAEDSADLSVEYVRENAPQVYIKNANIIRMYPIVRGIKKFGPIDTVRKADAVYKVFVEEVSGNLVYLHDLFKEELRQAASLWYDGANKMANDMAAKYGVSPEQVAGVIASLSPQKDWYQNVRLAELVFEAFDKNPTLTEEMIGIQKSINEEAIKRARKKGPEQLERAMSNAEKAIATLSQYIGQSLNDVPADIKPFLVRLSNEVSGEKDYNILAPDGEVVGVATNQDGTKSKLAWGSYSEIGKAVSIRLDGSPQNISRSLGEQHKIRNFYNNIIDPMSKDGDVTIDTHAVAAGLLMPVSGSSPEVEQNFGGKVASSAPIGIKGLYYAYSDAYAKAAEKVGLLPRQMQSITWEAIRTMMSDTFKANKDNVKQIRALYDRYVKGEISKSQLRKEIENATGGIKDPAWAGLVLTVPSKDVRPRADRATVQRDGRVAERESGVEAEAIEPTLAEDSIPVAKLTEEQAEALKKVKVKKPALRQKKAMTNEEARESLNRKGRKPYPTSTDDALTADEVRVYFMDKDFNWATKLSQPYNNVANLFAEMVNDPDFHIFPSIIIRGGFMTMDTSVENPELEMNIRISPAEKDGVIYIEAIELIDPKLAGTRAGTRLMNRITAAADKLGLTIKLDAYPTRRYQAHPVTRKQYSEAKLAKMAKDLTKFYEKFGFSVTEVAWDGAQSMKRSPQTLEGKNAIRQKKGLITITPTEGIKYQKAGVQEKYQQEAIKMIGEILPALEDKGRYATSLGGTKDGVSPSPEEQLQARYTEQFIRSVIDGLVGDSDTGISPFTISIHSDKLRTEIKKTNLKDVNAVVILANRLFSDSNSPAEAINRFLESIAWSVSTWTTNADRYMESSLEIINGNNITKDILRQAQEAEDMRLSRKVVRDLEDKATDDWARQQLLEDYQTTQNRTMSKWTHFLRYNKSIPPAIRLMLFDAVVTHNYDARTGSYKKRSRQTLRNYTPYDEGTISRMVGEQTISSDAVLKEYVEIMMANAPNVVKAFKMYDTAEGTWLKFPGGDSVSEQDINDNANALSQLVQDTPWCTKTAAESQLQGGDFYVFVTADKDGLPKARIAVRTTRGTVDEVRGILQGQQMEPKMRPVAEQFLESGAVPGGEEWAEGQRVNEKIRIFGEELSKRPLILQDFRTVSSLTKQAEQYEFMQYGENGFVERLKEDLDLKLGADDFAPELKGKIARGVQSLTPETVVLVGPLSGDRLIGQALRTVAIEAMKDGKRIGGPVSVNATTLKLFTEAINIDVAEVGRFASQYVADVRGSNLRVFDLFESLIEAYGEEGAVRMVSSAMPNVAKNLTHVIGDYNQQSQPIPANLKVVEGDATIQDENSTGNIESVGGNLYIQDNSLDFHIGVTSVDGVVRVSREIRSLGNLTTVQGTLNIIEQQELESLGKLEYVGRDLDLLYAKKLMSLGELKVVGGDLALPPTIITLGKMKRLGRFEYGLPDTLESFGELEEIGPSPIIIGEESRLRDLGKLKKLEGLEVIENKTLRSLGPHLKEIDGRLRITLGSSGLDFGALETVRSLLITQSDNYTGYTINLGSIRNVSGGISISPEVNSFGDLEYVGGSLQFTPSENFKDTGKLKTVVSDLMILGGSEEGFDSTPIVISNLVTVGGSFFSTSSRVKSLGSIEEIAGNGYDEFISAPHLESSGNLLAKSVDLERYSLARKDFKKGFISEKLFNDIQRLHGEYLRAEAGVEPPPAIRQKKGDDTAYQNWSAKPQSQAQDLGHRFNMNHKGFVPATTDPAQFRIAVRKLDDRLGTKPRRDERTGEVSGYHMTLDGKFFNPFLRVIGGGGSTNSLRRQGYGAGTQSIYEFINDVREKGYTDRVIAAFLKEQGYSTTEIKSALAVPIDVMGTMLPDGFANAEGGVAQGQAFFNELTKKIKRYANAKRLGVLLHNAADVRAKAQELLVNSPFFKAQSPTIQAEMQIGLDKALNIPAANKKFQADFKALRAMLSNMKKGAAEMDKAKRAMRMFIRKNLPKTVFDKADVNKLMKAITDSTPDSLPAVMERVTGFVNEFYVRDLSAAISKLLKTPTTRMVSGRRVGRVSVSLQNILGLLTNKKKPMLVDEDMSPENIEDLMQKQEKRFNELSVKTTLTQGESDKMNALSIALMYNEAMLMEDNNPHKVDALAAVRDNLRTLISTGRSQMRGELDAQRAYYEQLISDAYNGITGEELDLSEKGKKVNEEKLIELKNKEERRKTFDGGIKSFVGKIKNFVDDYFTKHMDLALLLQRISSGLSEAMGGKKLMEIFDERLFKARVSFVSGKMQVFDIISNKAKEIWGDNYKLEMQRNAVPVRSKDLINDENVIWLNEEKANKLKKEYDSATKKRKAEIIKELEALEILLSENQAYYWYNLYKDPANVASFKTMFKEEYARIMQQVTDRLDDKTKEWADWQVNELFPSLYERYNEVYKAIYRTNMPWNQFYAGRIFREGEDGDLEFNLLDNASQYQTSVGGQSTKARVKNARRIGKMDGNSALNSYLKDMEYFRAYAEPMRDLSKVLGNDNVKAAIIELGGENTYNALEGMMKKIATKGAVGKEPEFLNTAMSMYVKSKLAFNPTIFLKQLTSAFAFADYIGYTNWSKYTALALPQARKLWKEWYANSPLLQERYENSNIGDILEGYSYERTIKESPILVDKMVGGKEITVTKEQTRNLMNSLMYLVKQGDKGGIMGGLANYLYYKQQYLEKNPGDEAGAQRYASEKATKEALRTQQDSGITNKDWYQTSLPSWRFLNVFQSSPKALLRREMSAFMSLSRKMRKLPTEDGYGDIARRVMTYHVLVPMVFQWVALGLPGLLSDWDDEDKKALGRAALVGNFNALFILGDALSAVYDFIQGKPWAGDFKTIAILSQASLILKDAQRFSEVKDPAKKDKYMWRMINHIAEFTGLPASNIHKMIKNIEAIPDSKDIGEALLRLFNYSEYVIEGDKEAKDKEIEAYRKAMLGE